MSDINKVVVDGVTYDIGGGAVSGVKGDAESSYRTGDVNITPANIGAKAVQSAVSSPERNGNSIQFIDTISQDSQGVITATKKQVQEATSTQSGILSSAKFREIGAIRKLALAAYPTDTASGSAISITDGADGLPVKSLVVDIEPVQSGSGDPSPDNVRAINGWTGAQITVNSDVISITFPTEAGTVYGGTLDVTNGVLTVDRAMVTVSTSTGTLRNNGQSSITTRAFFTPNLAKLPGMTDFISDRFAIISSADAVGKMAGRTTAGAVEFYLPVSVPNTAAGVQSWFAENATQLVYPLANPVTYQLAPQEVTTLLGNNTIYADTGDVTVIYRADPTLFASKGQTEDDMTADAAIASGAYFQIGNTLYKATAAIATGETIVPGTNCTVTNIAEALNLLNA